MPGFMSSGTALTVFKIKTPESVTASKLKQYAFLPIDNTSEAKGWGWTSIEDMLDTRWERSVPEKGHFMAFALRVDTRKVQGQVLKKHLQEVFRKEEEKNKAEGKSFISRARKKELKDLHTSKLLSKTEPAPAMVDVAVDVSNGIVYVASTSKSMLDLCLERMELSFGELPEFLYVLDKDHAKAGQEQTIISQIMRNIYDGEQSVQFDGHSYTLTEAGQVSLAGLNGDGEGVEVTSKNGLDSTAAGLEAGLSISKLKIRLERAGDANAWCFVLNTNYAFSGLKTPHVEKTNDEDEDPDAKLLEKLYLISLAVSVMGELFRAQVG